MKRSLIWETLVLALGVFAIAAVPAKANLLPFLSSTSPAGSNTLFSYSVQLSNDERIDASGTGNTAFFTIYDFAGYVNGSVVAPANWTATVQNTGITPVGVSVTDNPSIVNLTFTYVGNVTVNGTGQVFSGFSAVSTYSSTTINGAFSQQSTKNVGGATGTRDYGAGGEIVPIAPANTPEPSTIVLLGAGLALVAAKARKRFV